MNIAINIKLTKLQNYVKIEVCMKVRHKPPTNYNERHLEGGCTL